MQIVDVDLSSTMLRPSSSFFQLLAPSYATAGHPRTETVGVVITARTVDLAGPVELRPRGASEFSRPD